MSDRSAVKFGVLFVCTGNICRSPIAEQVFRSRLGSPVVTFSSAGTQAMVGKPMEADAVAVVAELGAYPQEHRGRQLTPDLIDGADVVITMTRQHRRDVVRMLPRAARYTFTLRELVRLIETVEDQGSRWPDVESGSVVDRLREAVTLLAAHRGHAPAQAAEDDDIADPYRKGELAFRQTGETINVAVSRVVAAVESVVSDHSRSLNP